MRRRHKYLPVMALMKYVCYKRLTVLEELQKRRQVRETVTKTFTVI